MTITRYTGTAIVAVALGVTVAATSVSSQSSHTLVLADQVQWGPAPPALPPGAEIAVLEGNPAAKGPVTLRLKFPANYDVPPHWHSMDERLTVMSGALRVGMGDTIDRQHSATLAPGGFVSLPAKMHHYAWTTTQTVVQISLEGPFDVYYINAADDPQRRPSTR